jgi:ligand-binding sensor domain-containing protein
MKIAHPNRSVRLRSFRSTCSLLAALSLATATALSAANAPAGWFKIRTSGVPQRPDVITADAGGDLWIGSSSGNEKGIWRWPAGGELLHLTGSASENDFGRSSNLLEKPELAGQAIASATRDALGQVWYALEEGGVRVEKTDGSWVAFDTSQPAPRQLLHDRIQRIRFTADGQTLIVGFKSAHVVNAAFQIIQSRSADWNNDFVNDMLKDSQGRFWVVTNRGAYRGASIENWTHVSSVDSEDPNVPPYEVPVTRIEEDQAGNIWLTSGSYSVSAIYRYTAAGAWEKFTTLTTPELGTPAVADITVNRDNGDVWFGMFQGHGLVRYSSVSGWSKYRMVADLGIQSALVNSLVWRPGQICFVSDYNPGVPGNGTGVHFLALNENGAKAGLTSYAYMEDSQTLPSNRCRAVAADKSGSVWFGAYDRPAISRRMANGTWQMWVNNVGDGVNTFPITYGITAMGVDSANRVYFYPNPGHPFAYNADTDEWISLPTCPWDFDYAYGLHVDRYDGKWFHHSNGVYHLSADNTTWTRYSTAEGLPSQYCDYGVRVDRYDNVWIGTRGGVVKITPDNEWTVFKLGDGSGYSYGNFPYSLILDDRGEIWGRNGIKYHYATNSWSFPEDTSAFDNRNLSFPNGTVFIGTDAARARGIWIDPATSPIGKPDEDMMTLGVDGTVYIGQWMFDNDFGITAYTPPPDALAMSPGALEIGAAASTSHEISITATRAWNAATDASWITLISGAAGFGDATLMFGVTANANPGAAPRIGTITVTTQGGLTESVTVTQQGKEPPATGQQLTNPSFENGATGWQLAPGVDPGEVFGQPGQADLHAPGFIGTLLWQELDISPPAGLSFQAAMTLAGGPYPDGASIAVYLDYVDEAGDAQRLLLFNPWNSLVASLPEGTVFTTRFLLPEGAQRITGFSVDRLGFGAFIALEFSLQANGFAIPIATFDQLAKIGDDPDYPLNGSYFLVRDLSPDGSAAFGMGQPFPAIGGGFETPIPFTGLFDGQGHVIHDLVVNQPERDGAGLFRFLAAGAVVRDLRLLNADVRGRSLAGVLAGMNEGGTVERCEATGQVRGDYNLGGLIGANQASISECHADVSVTRVEIGVPGLWIGLGGLAGINTGRITNCHAFGEVAGTFVAGGGLVGHNFDGGSIDRCYAVGPVNVSGAMRGSLVGDGMTPELITNSFWNTETVEIFEFTYSFGGTGKTTAELQDVATYTDSGWDFDAIWTQLAEGAYPVLRALQRSLPPVEAPSLAVRLGQQTFVSGGAPLAFGNHLTGRAVTRTILLENTGTAPLTDLAVTLAGAQSLSFTLAGPRVTSLDPGETTTLDLTFTPVAVGDHEAVLEIASNITSPAPFLLGIEGVGNELEPLMVAAEAGLDLRGELEVVAVRGLPAGLRFDVVSGSITGMPTRAGTSFITVTVRYTDGRQATERRQLTVAPLPTWATGAFFATLAPNAAQPGSLGGRLTFNVAASGAVTGSLLFPGQTWRVTARLRVHSPSQIDIDTTLTRRGSDPIVLIVDFSEQQTLTGAVLTEVVEYLLHGWQQTWHSRRNRVPAERLGRLNTLAMLDETSAWHGDSAVCPQGTGYFTLTINTAGSVRWVGRLGDGTSVTFSSPLGPTGQLGLWSGLYGNTGAVHLTCQQATDASVTGMGAWLRLPQA